MKLSQIARSLGIQSYPEALDAVYEAQCFCDPCDRSVPAALQAQYALFGNYYDGLLLAMEALPKDPARYIWAQVVSTYIQTVPVEISSRIPMPTTDGTPAGDLLPLIILLPLIPDSIAQYRRKGFSEEAIHSCLEAYRGSLDILTAQNGRPLVNQLYFWWLGLYAKAAIYHCGSFQFELRKHPNEAVLLRDRKTGSVVPVMTAVTLHRSGRILGSAGCEDAEGALPVTLRETETAWYGHASLGAAVSMEECCFPKDRWESLLKPQDHILSMHISRGAKFSPEAVSEALTQARRIAMEAYPEFHIQGITCHSWLLDPTLETILGNASNIANFGSRFARYPVRSKGRDVFGYVFPANAPIDATLPENTRLQRGLKKLYLKGGYIYSYAGFLL